MSEDQFPCPFCGEKISKSAKLCRFCKSTVSYDLYIFQIPEDTKRKDIVQKILEKDNKKFFSTFGAARKALEKKNEPFLQNLRMEDVEKFTQIFQDNDIPFDQTIHNHNINPTFWTKKNIMMVTMSVAALSMVIYFYRNPPPSFLAKLPQKQMLMDQPMKEITLGGKTSETEPDERDRQESPKLTKETHATIENLLISTATVFADNSEGSAFFVSKNGHLISNHHVTKSIKDVLIQTFDGKRFKGKVLKSDPYYDLCLIQIDSTDYPPLKLGDATKLHPGDTVWTIGSPHGLSFSVTKGIVSFVGRNVNGKAFVQADVAINPGNSGGPMITDDGEVIGINNFIMKETQGLNFAIPVNYLYMGTSPILADVIETKPDSGTMVTWRSWERGNPTPASTTTTEPAPEMKSSEPNEMDSLVKRLKAADDDLAARQRKKDAEIADMQGKIDDFKKGFQNAQTVSDQDLILETIRKLGIQKIDLEIGKLDHYLNYNKSVMDLMVRAKQITSYDSTASQHYEQEISKLKKNKIEAESQKETKITDRKSLEKN